MARSHEPMPETPAMPLEDDTHEAAQHEIETLRRGLWACYEAAGGDPQQYASDRIEGAELVALVLDCVRDLRGLFDAARHDLR